MIREFDTFCEHAGGPNLRPLDDFEKKKSKVPTLAGFGPPPGHHFLGPRSTWRGFSPFFKNIAFSEMIREFDTFCEQVGGPNLRPLDDFEKK